MKDEQGNSTGKKFLDDLRAKILAGNELNQTELDYLTAINIKHNRVPSQAITDAEAKAKADEQAKVE